MYTIGSEFFSNHVLSAWHTFVVCLFILLPLEKYNANGLYDAHTHTHTPLNLFMHLLNHKKLEVQDGLSCLVDCSIVWTDGCTSATKTKQTAVIVKAKQKTLKSNNRLSFVSLLDMLEGANN